MESIWRKGQTMPHFPPLRGTVKTQVLVIGGGMAGLLCAHRLHQAGVDCCVVEENRIAGGVTGNTTAKITAQHGLIYRKLLENLGQERAKLYLQANLFALDAYRELCRSIPCDFEEKDHIVFSRDDRAGLEAELDALEKLGYPAQLAENPELPFPTVGGVRFPAQGQFDPLQFLAAIAEDLTIYQQTPVLRLTRQGADTDHGRIQAEAVIVATHFPMFNRHGSYFLKLYQQRSYVLALENAPIPPGMYLEDRENGLSLRSRGSTLLLGGGGHWTGCPGGGWEELEQAARQYYPEARISCRWATQDCMSLDGLPYIGRYSAATPNLYVATGFNKWGMTTSMLAAHILRDLITGKDNPYAALFSPSRSMLCPQLGINLKESAKNLLTPSSRRCTHLGCALKWNPQEHSWDCPCHGSRFSEDGTRLDNPAKKDLPPED